ncbi:MAG: SCP2 sterol-binding domain-containing protein [Acidimicrobiia bacterium]|jgi:predicted lipid carrier protein YhbT
MLRPLTSAWLERYRELGQELPPVAGATAEVEHTVTKTPEGDVTFTIRYEDGRPTAATLAPGGHDAVRITLTHPDALAMARGELDVPTGFMQGRIKLVGSTERFLSLQGALQRDEHRALLRALAHETDA